MLSGDIKKLIFKRVISAKLGEVSLDSKMLTILMEIDGSKNVAEISGITSIDMATCSDVIRRLHKLQLIEPLNLQHEKPQKISNSEFIEFLVSNLSIAIGPIAEVILEDEIFDMGESIDFFPAEKNAELVNRLASQIPREEKKIAFKQTMANAIKKMSNL